MHIVCVFFVIKQTHSSSYFVYLDQKHPLATKWPVLANLRWTKTWSPYLCNTMFSRSLLFTEIKREKPYHYRVI